MTPNRYFDALLQRHRQTMAATLGPGKFDRNFNLILAGVCALGMLLLGATWGYHVGFAPINRYEQHLSWRLLEEVTNCGDYLLAICLMALLARRQPRVLWMAVLATAYTAIFSLGLKELVNAARPPAVLGGLLNVVGPVLRAHSFPSGHTATAFVTAACFSVGASKRGRLLFYTLAAAVGVSRVLVGVHWPIDVLAGAGVAGLSVALATHTMKNFKWGASLTTHLLVVSLIAACGVLVLCTVPAYPLARPLTILIAVLSLAILARDYLIEPLTLSHAAAS